MISASAMASFPTVGDTATYYVIDNGAVSTQTWTVSAVDAANDNYTLIKTIVTNNQTSTVISYPSIATFSILLMPTKSKSRCENWQGNQEKIKVGKKKITTCHFGNAQNDPEFWLGNVPFAIVKKIDRSNNSIKKMDMISFESH